MLSSDGWGTKSFWDSLNKMIRLLDRVTESVSQLNDRGVTRYSLHSDVSVSWSHSRWPDKSRQRDEWHDASITQSGTRFHRAGRQLLLKLVQWTICRIEGCGWHVPCPLIGLLQCNWCIFSCSWWSSAVRKVCSLPALLIDMIYVYFQCTVSNLYLKCVELSFPYA